MRTQHGRNKRTVVYRLPQPFFFPFPSERVILLPLFGPPPDVCPCCRPPVLYPRFCWGGILLCRLASPPMSLPICLPRLCCVCCCCCTCNCSALTKKSNNNTVVQNGCKQNRGDTQCKSSSRIRKVSLGRSVVPQCSIHLHRFCFGSFNFSDR